MALELPAGARQQMEDHGLLADWEERAAIMEHEGNMQRGKAEWWAYIRTAQNNNLPVIGVQADLWRVE